MKTVLASNYSPIFTPGAANAGTINFSGIPGFANNRLMAIMDQTQNILIYGEGLTGYGGTWDTTGKILTLTASTVSCASSDLLQVIFDSPAITTTPAEAQFDAINKQRVIQPQSLIDTDFEYGLQPAKWEFLNLNNNRPTAFFNAALPLTVGVLSANNTRTVTVSTNTYPGSGVPIFVQESYDPNANGWFLTDSVGGQGNWFTYTTTNQTTVSGNILNGSRTYIYPGNFYTQSAIPVSQAAGGFLTYTSGTTTLTGTTLSAHGLSVNSPIYIVNCTTAAAYISAINGSFNVLTTPTANTFTFNISSIFNGTTITATAGLTGALFARPNGYAIHRSYDGGVFFTCGAVAPNTQAIRQTRRYFRYQAGKGISFSTGTILKPAMFVDSLTANVPGGSLTNSITATVKFPSGVTTYDNVLINVSGVTNDPNYNGTNLPVTATINPNVFVYTAPSIPTISYGVGTPITITPNSWYGQTSRIGMFDSQNGVFFEHDGQTLSVVRRSSTTILQGTGILTQNTNILSGVGTYFTQQLVPGSFIVLRGQSYRVLSIPSDTQLTMSPEYRGVSETGGVIIAKTIDLKIPQSQWNLDKMDGTGPSGYTIDLTKMQMFCIDYSWYGAGFIRWGLRAADGSYTYCHKMLNNNVNTVAYMRAGNLPARYEENTIQPITTITGTVNSSDTVVNVANVSGFPPSGTARIMAPGSTGVIEYITYGSTQSSGGLTALKSVTRGVFGGSQATTFTYNAAAPIAVELAGAPPAAALSHWGSSVIMEGQYQTDLVYSFNTGSQDAGTASLSAITTVAPNVTVPLLSIRLAPSVDSGKTGLLGAKEVINRMQLKLQSMDAITNGLFRLSLVLNGNIYTNQPWVPVTNPGTTINSSLAQVCYHSNNVFGTSIKDTLSGGESIFGFYTASNSNTGYNETTYDLTSVRDLGTSAIGGGTNSIPSNNSYNVYPDGPDVVTVLATNLGTTTQGIGVRLSWAESQS